MNGFDKYSTKGAYHYDWYAKGEPDWYKKAVDRCVEFCKGSTLDVGGGDGVVSELIKERGYDVTCLDSDTTALELASSRGIPTLLQDIKEPVKGKWDYMVCLNVIEHLDWPARINGIFNKNIAKAAIIITDIPQDNPSPYHIKEYSPYELKQMFYTRNIKWFKIDENFHGVEVYK